ncbi:hypothetical protein V8E36_004309 [Tilletia maclaganii]
MKTLRRSQTLAILAAGNGLQWRRSQACNESDPFRADPSSSTGIFGTALGCTSCLWTDDDSQDDEFEQEQRRPIISKPLLTGSSSNLSVSSGKYCSSMAPSLPPLECESVHITFRRDIVLSSPSSWNSESMSSAAAKVEAWADLIPTPPARSSSRTSASYPVIRRVSRSRHPYQLTQAAVSSPSVYSTNNIERASILPLAIKSAQSLHCGLSDTFSPVHGKARQLHEIEDTEKENSATKGQLKYLRSSTQLQACIASGLPSQPRPAYILDRHGVEDPKPSQEPVMQAFTQTFWATTSASVLSSTETLVPMEDKSLYSHYDSLAPLGRSGSFTTTTTTTTKGKIPVIRAPELLDVVLTPPSVFSKSGMSPSSYTLEAVSVPASPNSTYRRTARSTFGYLEPLRQPLTPNTFDTFDTAGTPLVNRFPRIVTPDAGAPGSHGEEEEEDGGEGMMGKFSSSLRLQDMCGTTPRVLEHLDTEAPRLELQQTDPAFLSPHWTSPAREVAPSAGLLHTKNTAPTATGSSSDTLLSTPRCRMGMLQSSLSASTNWLLRTAIQASDAGPDTTSPSASRDASTGSAGQEGENTDLANFELALDRLQAAVSVPLTRQSIDATALVELLGSDVVEVEELHAVKGADLNTSAIRPQKSPELSDLLRELGMQPFTPPLGSGNSSGAFGGPSSGGTAAAESWAARCGRSLCKAVRCSGLSPGSLLDFVAPESPERDDGSRGRGSGRGSRLAVIEDDEVVPIQGEAEVDGDGDKTPRIGAGALAPGSGASAGAEFESPAPSFNFSICQRTPTLDDFPYTIAMLASLRKCRNSYATTADAPPGAKAGGVESGGRSRLGLSSMTTTGPGRDEVYEDDLDCRDGLVGVSSSLSMPMIGLGFDDPSLVARPTGKMVKIDHCCDGLAPDNGLSAYLAGGVGGGGGGGGADSIFELYGCLSTPTIPQLGVHHGPTTSLRRSASDASLSTIRSTQRASARRISSSAALMTPRLGGGGGGGPAWSYGHDQQILGVGPAARGNWRLTMEPRCPPPACPLPPLPDLPSRISLLQQRPARTLL